MGNVCGGNNHNLQRGEIAKLRAELEAAHARVRELEPPQIEGRNASYSAAQAAIKIKCNKLMRHVDIVMKEETAKGQFTATVDLQPTHGDPLSEKCICSFNRVNDPELTQLVRDTLQATYGPKYVLMGHDIYLNTIVSIFVDLRP